MEEIKTLLEYAIQTNTLTKTEVKTEPIKTEPPITEPIITEPINTETNISEENFSTICVNPF